MGSKDVAFKVEKTQNKKIDLNLVVSDYYKKKDRINEKTLDLKKTIPDQARYLDPCRISIITCVSNNDYLINVFGNYHRQISVDKELIIVIKNNDLDLCKWQKYGKGYKDIRIYKPKTVDTSFNYIEFGKKHAKHSNIVILNEDVCYPSKYVLYQLKKQTRA